MANWTKHGQVVIGVIASIAVFVMYFKKLWEGIPSADFATRMSFAEFLTAIVCAFGWFFVGESFQTPGKKGFFYVKFFCYIRLLGSVFKTSYDVVNVDRLASVAIFTGNGAEKSKSVFGVPVERFLAGLTNPDNSFMFLVPSGLSFDKGASFHG